MSEAQQNGEATTLYALRGGSWITSRFSWTTLLDDWYLAASRLHTRGGEMEDHGFRCARKALAAPVAENATGVLTARREAL